MIQKEYEKLVWEYLRKYLDLCSPDEVFSEYDEASSQEREKMLSSISSVVSRLRLLSFSNLFKHFSPGCACGENEVGELFIDPICAKNNLRTFQSKT